MDFARIGTNVLSGKGQDCTKGSILKGWPAHIPIIAEKPLNMQVSTLFLLFIAVGVFGQGVAYHGTGLAPSRCASRSAPGCGK